MEESKTNGTGARSYQENLKGTAGYQFITLRDRPEMTEPGAEWFHSK